MATFETHTFDIPELKGISQESIEEHLKLYAGYVKHSNLILEEMQKGNADAYALAEMQRRFGFEFCGMRNHEYYFALLEGGAQELGESPLKEAIANEFGSFEKWLEQFKTLAKTRGVGWAILYFDPKTKQLINAWIDEQHLGQLIDVKPIVTLDMWEHSFVFDYKPSGKGQYVDDFFENINWSVAEAFFSEATK